MWPSKKVYLQDTMAAVNPADDRRKRHEDSSLDQKEVSSEDYSVQSVTSITRIDHREDNERRVLVLYTGGTIGMKRGPDNKLGPQLFASAMALKCSRVDVPGFQNIFRRVDVFRLLFHFFLPLFITGLLLLSGYIGVVESAPNCDVSVCCYVLLIRAVWS
uniref:Asparaginase n=1 Tax=Timema monikensis TaxID=170555 RepID=A0A7R9HPT5_9NEOP|nr:unnamed protein product [Timema monikensis]